MEDFQLVVLTPPGLARPALAIAASRAGGLGVLDLSFTSTAAARAATATLARYARGACGIRLDGSDTALAQSLLTDLPEPIRTIILAAPANPEWVERLQAGGRRRVWLEVTNLNQAALGERWGADGLVAKGHEAGGWVGEETTFILLQQLAQATRLPIYAQGGIGLHTAAAAYVAGAAGVVLGDQLALVAESQLPDHVKEVIATMDGSETVVLGQTLGLGCRMYTRPDAKPVAELRAASRNLNPGQAAAWREAVAARAGWGRCQENAWLLGQDAVLAKPFAARFHNVSGVLSALRASVRDHVNTARTHKPFAEHAPLARSHATRYPIVQGPMTRVSDTADFALCVAEEGGLPFLALALMRAPELEALLQTAADRLGDRPWGVGILGFVSPDLRQEQLGVVRRFKPPFALIAGGRPDQAHELEREGIATYLHVPSPALLRLFMQDGARRFVFEGRECGGHVGPRTSFVLWETMIDALLEQAPGDLENSHVLLAGGIHDARSSAMAAAIAAPLAEKGVKVGVLLGTGYLFTQEAIAAGAILPGFQQVALQCDHTVTLESGPGHATRCAENPFTQEFEAEKQRLFREGLTAEQVREALEQLNLGRLRIAAKGIARHPRYGQDPAAPKFISLDDQEQRRQGMFMIGQLAALREATCTIADLHQEVSAAGSAWLDACVIQETQAGPRDARQPSAIAIIGIECILPKADNRQQYWDNILRGVCAITEVPRERWDADLYFDPDPAARDKIYSRWGGFINDIPFDPLEFGLPPNSLKAIDPMQLLALKVARAALADAGYLDRDFDRSRTAVILGASGGVGELGEYYMLRSGLPMLFGAQAPAIVDAFGGLPEWTEDSFAGLLLNVAAGRIANRLDLGGPNYVVDAACASSLAAVHLAVKELESHNADMVIAGGVDTVQNPFSFMCFSTTRALSPKGQPRTFDAEADGIAISEGIVVIILKRLEDAERDGDRVYAVIRGVGCASDGRGKSMTAPRPEGQMLALQRAYARAGIHPTTVDLFEAHGTGTAVGDRAEALALGAFLEQAGARPNSHAVGSVKSMIGHTKATAGMAGLVKAALALYHKVLPATLGVTQPNPAARLGEGPLYVNSETRPWIHAQDQPRRAGVSAFGFGGTNFHAVVEEYQDDWIERRAAVSQERASELFLWSGLNRRAIATNLRSLAQALEDGARPRLRDLAYTLWKQFERSAQARLAVVAESLDDLQSKLNAALANLERGAINDPRGISYDENTPAGKVAFLFPGQGSQYPNMLRDLAIHFSQVRQAFELSDAALAGQFDRPLSRLVFPPPAFDDETRQAQSKALTATNVAQPALGAAAMGAYHLLNQLGVHPDMLAGHSYGEYAALCAAGAMDAETLARLSEARGRCIIQAAQHDLGTMAAAAAGPDQVQAALGDLPEVWVSNLNAPQQTMLSGTKAGIARAIERLEQAGIRSRSIPVAAAFHSPIVAPAQASFAHYLQGVNLNEPQIDVFSNTTAAPYPRDPATLKRLLADHLVKPVRFVQEIEAMYAAGARFFVEVGPNGVLTGLTRQILGERPHLAVAVDHPQKEGMTQLHSALAHLAAGGAPVNLEPLFEGRAVRRLDLGRLVEDTRPEPLSPTTWLVNGGGARPHQQPVRARRPLQSFEAVLPGSDKEQSARPARPSAGTRPEIPPATATNESDPVMLQFQALMSHFLDTQRSVMLAYLQGTGQVPPAAELPALQPMPAIQPAPSPAPVVAPEPAPGGEAAPSTALPTESELTAQLLGIVAERTGYPTEMLDLGVDMEADLGIDSIKRVEILGAFFKRALPAGFQARQHAMEQLTAIKTLGGIIRWTCQAAQAEGNDTAPAQAPAGDEGEASVPEPQVPRSIFEAMDAPPPQGRAWRLSAGHSYVITDDGKGVAAHITEYVRRQGGQPILVRTGQDSGVVEQGVYRVNLSEPAAVAQLAADIQQQHGPIGGILHLLPLAGQPAFEQLDLAAWRACLQRDVKSLFYLIKASAESLAAAPGAFVVAAAAADEYPGQASIGGLLKTAAREWPAVRVSVIDLDLGHPAPVLAEQVWQELCAAEPQVVVRYRGSRRQVLRQILAPLDTNQPQLEIGPDWVVLVTGGASGITAQVALSLAQAYKPTLVLLGRSPLPPPQESPDTAPLTEAKDIKAAIINRMRQTDSVSLAAVEAAYHRLIKEREMRDTLARLADTGARVRYLQADVRDAASLHAALESVYGEFGRIDGVIHGAGIIEDKLIVDKTPESFDRVFDTKADGAFLLSHMLRADSLQFLVLFSSASGAFGNRGQSDYAAANAVLNKLALYLDRRWRARVVALGWGPWAKTGMVSAELQRQFAAQGVQLISIPAGCRAMDQELRFGRKGQAEVILAGGRWEGAGPAPPAAARPGLPLLAGTTINSNGAGIDIVRTLDPAHDRYLLDHQLDGKPVLPAAVALELMAEAAQQAQPDLHVIGLRDLQMLRGVVLDDHRPVAIRVVATAQSELDGPSLAVHIADAGDPRRLHYRAIVEMGDRLPPAPGHKAPDRWQPYPLSVDEAYRRWLFHGPIFQAITSIDGWTSTGLASNIRPSSPHHALAGHVEGEWLIDPIVFDCGLQTIILWARAQLGATPLITRCERYHRYGPLSAQPVKCYLDVRHDAASRLLTVDMAFVGAHGQLLGLAYQVTCPYTQALNRLADKEEKCRCKGKGHDRSVENVERDESLRRANE